MAVVYSVAYNGALLSFSQVSATMKVDINDNHGVIIGSIENKRTWTEEELQKIKAENKAYDVFNVETEQVFQPHWHDDAEKRLILRGAGRFYIPLEDYVIIAECTAGDMVEIEGGVVHWFYSDAPITALRFFSENSSHVSQTTNIPVEVDIFYHLYGDIICTRI